MEVSYRNEAKNLRLAVSLLPWFERLLERAVDAWLCFVVGILPVSLLLAFRGQFAQLALLLAGVAGIISVLFLLIRRANSPKPDDFPDVTLRISPDIIELQTPTSWTRRQWHIISQVSRVRGSVLIQVDNGLWYIVPAGAFRSDEEARQFEALAKRYREEARQHGESRAGISVPSWFQLPPALFQLRYDVKREDFKKLFSIPAQPTTNPKNSKKPQTSSRVFLSCFIIVLIAVFFFLLTQRGRANPANEPPMDVPFVMAIASCPVLWIVGFCSIYQFRRWWVLRKVRTSNEEVTLTISGILGRSAGMMHFLHWKDVTGMSITSELIVLRVKPNVMQFIPRRAFAEPAEAQQFFDWCQEYWSAMHSEPNRAISAMIMDSDNPYESPRNPPE